RTQSAEPTRAVRAITGASQRADMPNLLSGRDLAPQQTRFRQTGQAQLTSPITVGMRIRQAVVVEPFKTGVREVDLHDPGPNQILVQCAWSAIRAGTELAVYTGTPQWLKDPNLPDWKFPFRPGYSAAGTVVAVGFEVKGVQPGERVSYPGNHASHELLTIGHERGRVWRLPDKLEFDKAAVACIARYALRASVR